MEQHTPSGDPVQILYCPICAEIPTHDGGVCYSCRADSDEIDLRTPGFPTWVYPTPLQRFIESVARAIPVPVQFIGTAILPIAAVAIGSRRYLIVSVASDFTEPSIVWVLLVGDSGCGKSPVLEIAAKPLVKRDAEYYEMYVREREAWSRLSKKEREDYMGGAPRRRPLVRTDATIETLTDDLQVSRDILAYFDEGRELTGQFQGYTAGRQESNRAKYLQMYGGRRLDRRRVGTEGNPIDILVLNPRLSILGGIQPGGLSKLLLKGNDDDGMAYRFLLTYGETVEADGHGSITDADWYEECVQWFFTLTERPMLLSSDGLLLLNGTIKKWRGQYKPEIVAKMKDYIARVALVLAHYWMYFEGQERDVNLEDLERAIELCQWHLDTYHKVEEHLVVTVEGKIYADTLEAVRRWFVRKVAEQGPVIRKRDVSRACIAGITEVRILNNALNTLESFGELEQYKEGPKKEMIKWMG